MLDENTYYLNEYLLQQDKLEESMTTLELSPLEISGYSFEDVVHLAREIFIGEDLTNRSIQTLRDWAFISWYDSETDSYTDLFQYCMDCWWTGEVSPREQSILEAISREAVIVSYEMHTGKGIEADESFDIELAIEMVLE